MAGLCFMLAAPCARHQRARAVVATAKVPASSSRSVLAVGGTGVAALVADALRARGVSATHVSAAAAFASRPRADTVVLAAGGGPDELRMYARACETVLQECGAAIVVARTLVVPDVVRLLQSHNVSGWAVVRPGALMSGERADVDACVPADRVLVTEDVRCNGIVSRAFVAAVLADVLTCERKLAAIQYKVVGLYDRERMISLPAGVVDLAR